MSRTWVISDTHFGHKNIIKFKDASGNPLRPYTSVEEMDDALVNNWNSVVSDRDTVYHLGDLAINRSAISTIGRCKGRKVLIKGNHDIFKLKDYLPYFDDIRAYKVMPEHGIIFSHIPVHPDQLYRFKLNVHGHLHSNLVHMEVLDIVHDGDMFYKKVPDDRYKNVSVEQINFTPIALQELIDQAARITHKG